jgi:Flp pilus assembly pilin Flp
VNPLTRMLADDEGGAMAEYGLILAVFSIVAMAGFALLVTIANGDLGRATTGLRGIADRPPS